MTKTGFEISGASNDDQISRAERPNWSQYTYKWRTWRQRVTPFEAIAEADYPGSGTPEDPFIVTWLDKDAENPRTYSTAFKISNLSLLALMCFCITFASSTYTAVEEQVTAEFDCSKEVFFIGLSLMLVGFAVGPILFAPLSEAFGRRNVVLITLAIHTGWAGLCSSAQNIQSLLVFRFFSGIFGSPAMVVPAGQLADIFEDKQRGLANTVFSAAPWLGPSL
jgi:Na+/melibiose symporter-like transporter